MALPSCEEFHKIFYFVIFAPMELKDLNQHQLKTLYDDGVSSLSKSKS